MSQDTIVLVASSNPGSSAHDLTRDTISLTPGAAPDAVSAAVDDAIDTVLPRFPYDDVRLVLDAGQLRADAKPLGAPDSAYRVVHRTTLR